jgi:crotonobetainyl-CoA:carnitine CoA-transferase CaiB-like acyl-CoA transferase
MEGLGLGYDDVRAADPAVVFCSITGFGRGGAGAALPGYDLLVQALSGFMSVTGDPAGEPQKAGVAVVDVMAGLFATVGILAALRHREATGEGQRVEVDLLSAALAGLVNLSAGYTVAGAVPGRTGNAHPSIAPYEPLPCAEGELVVAVGTDRQFASLCTVLGVAEVADEPRFATNRARVEHREALRELLVARLAARPAGEWATLLTQARVPAGLVNDLAGGFALAAQLGLDPIVEVARPDGSSVPLTRNPIRLSATPPTYRSAPPELGGGPGDG